MSSKQQISFCKMQGLGNDFMVIDATQESIPLSAQLIQRLSDRHFGIGFDQCLVLSQASDPEADFFYQIYNADGSEVAQCGNGARCVALFIQARGLSDKSTIAVQTQNDILHLTIHPDQTVTVNMGVPDFDPAHIPLISDELADRYPVTIEHQTLEFGAVALGNPHAVLLVEDVKTAAVKPIASHIQSDPRFPKSVNVGFMQIDSPEHIRLRVYERGAGETLACGSGACAAVVIGQRWQQLSQTVAVDLPGGRLSVSWQGEGQPVWMTGPAQIVYEGSVDLTLFND